MSPPGSSSVQLTQLELAPGERIRGDLAITTAEEGRTQRRDERDAVRGVVDGANRGERLVNLLPIEERLATFDGEAKLSADRVPPRGSAAASVGAPGS